MLMKLDGVLVILALFSVVFVEESVQGCPEEWKYKDNPPRCEGPITDTYTKEMCRLEIIEEPMFKSATLEDGQTKCVKKFHPVDTMNVGLEMENTSSSESSEKSTNQKQELSMAPMFVNGS